MSLVMSVCQRIQVLDYGRTIAAGVINNDYVADAGLNPKDAIYQDDAESEEARPYINVWVAPSFLRRCACSPGRRGIWTDRA